VPAFFDPHQTSNCHMSILALYPKPDMPLFGPLISRSTVTEYCALAAGCMCQLSVHRDDRMASDRHKTAALLFFKSPARTHALRTIGINTSNSVK
jgi:hypothetical protein